MSLHHANVCFPAKIAIVDSLNQYIHLVRWNVVVVRVATLTTSALMYLHVGASAGLCSKLHKCLLSRCTGSIYLLMYWCIWGIRLLSIGLNCSLCWHWWLGIRMWLCFITVCLSQSFLWCWCSWCSWCCWLCWFISCLCSIIKRFRDLNETRC